jgi:phosphotransacetylase
MERDLQATYELQQEKLRDKLFCCEGTPDDNTDKEQSFDDDDFQALDPALTIEDADRYTARLFTSTGE